MGKSYVDDKELDFLIKNIGISLCHRDESDRKVLRNNSLYREFNANSEMRDAVQKIAIMYFKDDISYKLFMENVFKDYSEYKDDYTFNVLLGQSFRRLYCKSLRKKELIKKLTLCYRKRYK